MRFDSCLRLLGDFPRFAPEVIREERSCARVPVDEAQAAGPCHRAFVEALPPDWLADPTIEIFSRMLWLPRGAHPLSPHYHLDWHLGLGGPRVETLMVLLGDVSRTEFLAGSIELPDDEERGGAAPSSRWGERVAEAAAAGRLERWLLPSETLLLFDNRTWHRARPAVAPGWRLLMRAIRGLPARADAGYENPGAFTTLRTGYVPLTDEEQRRHEPYRR